MLPDPKLRCTNVYGFGLTGIGRKISLFLRQAAKLVSVPFLVLKILLWNQLNWLLLDLPEPDRG